MPAALTIRSGSVRVRIFANRSGEYVRHEIRWRDHHGRPHRLKRSHKAEALREARRIADDLARGHHHAELSLADLASFRLARQHLYGTGKTIEQACGEFADAQRLLKARLHSEIPSLPEITRFYLAHSPTHSLTQSLPAVIASFLAAKQQQGISARWHATLRSQLERFRDDMGAGDMARLNGPAVQQWFLNLPALGARSKNNHLAAVQSLFGAPELRHHPERQSILELQPCVTAPSENRLWTPEEFGRLLHAASLTPSPPPGERAGVRGFIHCLPALVLGGFAKLRSSEIMRLHWPAVRLHESRLLLRAGQTKTRRTRLVPLPPCAVAWLRLCAPSAPAGPVWPWGTCKYNADLRALAAACQLAWRPNALRNSAVTYDHILNPDLARVAREAGNSPKILETEYLALDGVTRRTARAWFALRPPRTTAKILKLA